MNRTKNVETNMAIATLLGQALFLASLCLLGLILHKATRLDATLMSLLAGILGAMLIPLFGFDTGIRAYNIKDLVFYVILPVLIFGAAWHLKPALLKKWLAPITLLATLGVLLSFIIIGAIAYYAIASATGFPWIAALLLGAILSATDPVAIVSALQKYKAPEDLTTLIEGESLLNDATAVVLFSAVLGVALSGQSAGSSDYLLAFLYASAGGLIVGVALALLAVVLVKFLSQNAATTLTLMTLAFGSFYVAEHFFHFSGILSVMAAALVSKMLLVKIDNNRNSKTTLLSGIEQTWEWLNLFFNSLIFVLMGLVINFKMFTDQWLAILIAIFAMLVSRFIIVFAIGSLSRFTSQSIPLRWQFIMAWGGLRGAIAIVLVLSLPTSLPYWWTIQSMVFGAVLFTLLIPGLTSGYFIKKLKST